MKLYRTTAPILAKTVKGLELHYARPRQCNKIEHCASQDAVKAWGAWLAINAHDYPPDTTFYLVTDREKLSP